MNNSTTIHIDAAEYADHDDCLAAAADAYVAAHPEAEGWSLNARYEDSQRGGILLDVPGRYVVYPIDSPECDSVNRENVLAVTDSEAEAYRIAGVAAYPWGGAVLDTETGDIDYGDVGEAE